MNRWLMGAVAAGVLLSGCATVERGSIPVVEASGSVYDRQQGRGNAVSRPPAAPAPQAPASQAPTSAQDSGVVVMVPGAGASSAPIQAYPASGVSSGGAAPIVSQPITATTTVGGNTGYSVPNGPSGVPRAASAPSSDLAADEQLDGPILALLTTAQREQGSGNLESAASSLERAQRIAPREPQVLYRLAEVRLAQGDAAQAEQLARRALTYAGGRPALQASLWNLIAQARERQGDAAGAAQARERARVNL